MYPVHLRQFVWALSAAADLVGVTDIAHGKRVAFYAQAIARELAPGFPWSLADIILVGLLHDCGVSSTDVHERLVRELEWSHASDHCTRGSELLVSSALLRRFAGPVRLHHTRWSLFNEIKKADDDARLGNLIFLADRLDVLIANLPGEVLAGSDQILHTLNGFTGSLFNPEYIRALHKASRSEVFWLVRDDSHLQRHFEDWLEDDPLQDIDAVELTHLFGLFGLIVDGKSRYTGAHSKAVGELSFQIARKLGLDDTVSYRLGLAGLVHDIGKLRIPDSILNKPRNLDEIEFSTVKHHSFDALDILSQLKGFEDVARFSAMHHERLDGSGYPYQLQGAELSLEARILAIADIFQALAQNRPYRQGMQDEQIKCILELEASRGKIDPAVLKTVMDNFAELMPIARQQTVVL